MPRTDTTERDAQIIALDQARTPRRHIAQRLNVDPKTVRNVLERAGIAVGTATKAPRNEALEALTKGAARRQARPAEHIQRSGRPGEQTVAVEASERIATLDDLLNAAGVDRSVWEVSSWTANAWEGMGAEGGTVTLHQVKATLREKRVAADKSSDLLARVDGMIAAAAKASAARRTAPAVHARKAVGAVRQDVVIADPHLAKLAWGRSTGGPDYDINIARRLVWDAATELYELGERRSDIALRSIDLLGDYFHYDNPQGTTTGGTPQDRDSRVQRMIDTGAELAIELVEKSAERVKTQVMLVPGNHDEVLSWALQRILISEFRRHPNVTINTESTRRKYDRWGRVLLGFNHGDRRKKELPAAMAAEAPQHWGETVLREWHVGHLHNEGEEFRGTSTHPTVTVRTHRSLSPADQWHSDEMWIGAPRGMTAWYYHKGGALLGTDVSSPDFPEDAHGIKAAKPRRGAR